LRGRLCTGRSSGTQPGNVRSEQRRLQFAERAKQVTLITLTTGAPADHHRFDWLISRKVGPLAGQRKRQLATADWSPQQFG
jgi:hypothetical protein